MNMPVYERRFFIGLLTKEQSEKQAEIEKQREEAKTKGSKGNRTTKVSGQALKNKIKSGDLPLS